MQTKSIYVPQGEDICATQAVTELHANQGHCYANQVVMWIHANQGHCYANQVVTEFHAKLRAFMQIGQIHTEIRVQACMA